MGLHARNVAIMAGATEDILDRVVEELVKSGRVRMDTAVKIIEKIKQG